MSENAIEVARQLADDVLFPAALDVDRGGVVPVDQLDRVAEAGLFGIHSPVGFGGLGLDRAERLAVTEALSGGCLTTSFVWNQHGGPARATVECDGPPHERWARKLATGEARGGVAFSHLVRKGLPAIVAEPAGDGWTFTGTAPWVTGWGHIDVVLAAARYGDDIVWAVFDARDAPTLRSRRLGLAAVDSTCTVELDFDRHRVTPDEVTSVVEFDGWYRGYRTGLRENGSHALGVTSRCLRLLGPSPLDAELVAARRALDGANAEGLPAARARTTELGVRAAGALMAASSGAGMLLDHHAQRLAREALFLVVQGQTPEIKAEHLERFPRR